MTACPCGSGKDLTECCGPILDGAPAPTAEALMRSRYTAFTTGNIDHIVATLVPEERDNLDRAEIEAWSKESDWRGLEIRRTKGGGADDTAGQVEFVAKFVFQGQPQVHHETGSFEVRDGRWFYAQGASGPMPVERGPKVGRNEPCPCGSGKKFKKCCGA